MEYSNMIKEITLDSTFVIPTRLKFEDMIARPLSREDLDADLAAVNSSIEIIQKTRGGSWPSEQLTKDFDFLDLAWHEREFRDRTSFAYVLYHTDGRYLGCFYLYGIGLRIALTKQTINYEVDASWWVTSEGHEHGYYEKVYVALQSWLTLEFPFKKIYYSNKVVPKKIQQ
jgi:hypothetical protein